jgi:hypothetical protein
VHGQRYKQPAVREAVVRRVRADSPTCRGGDVVIPNLEQLRAAAADLQPRHTGLP